MARSLPLLVLDAGAALLLVALGRVAGGVGADGVAIEVLLRGVGSGRRTWGEARLIHTSSCLFISSRTAAA